jgi:hypothetical protein
MCVLQNMRTFVLSFERIFARSPLTRFFAGVFAWLAREVPATTYFHKAL